MTELNETGRATQPVRLLDIGCGTGAIALYLLTKLQKVFIIVKNYEHWNIDLM